MSASNGRGGKDRLSLGKLDKLDEPSSLIALREQVNALLPHVDLTDAILEIHGYTGLRRLSSLTSPRAVREWTTWR